MSCPAVPLPPPLSSGASFKFLHARFDLLARLSDQIADVRQLPESALEGVKIAVCLPKQSHLQIGTLDLISEIDR